MKLKKIIRAAIFLILLAGCTENTPTPTPVKTATPSASPLPTPTVPWVWNPSTQEPITAANIDHLELLQTWGMENLYNRGTGGDASLKFSPDGKTIAIGNYDSVQLWDVATGQMRLSLPGNEEAGTFAGFAFDPAGARIIAATAGSPYSLDFFDANNGALIKTRDEKWSDSGSYLTDMAISPDGKVIALLDGFVLRVQNLDQGDEVWRATGVYEVDQVVLSSDGKRFAVLRKNGRGPLFYIGDLKTGGLTEFMSPNYRVLAISPDLSYLISSGPDARFQLWTLDSRVLIGDFKSQSTSPDSSQAPELYLFSPDGNLIVSYQWPSDIRIWDLHTSGLLREIKPMGLVMSAAFSPDGRLLAVTDGAEIYIYGIKR